MHRGAIGVRLDSRAFVEVSSDEWHQAILWSQAGFPGFPLTSFRGEWPSLLNYC